MGTMEGYLYFHKTKILLLALLPIIYNSILFTSPPIFLIRLMENVRDIKRNPEKVLNSLTEHSKISDYKYERLD
jgi:hypothetical protein